MNKFTRKIIHFYRALTKKSPWVSCEVSVKKQWIGSKNGGFYVHSEHLNENSVIYSFGIGHDISFDKGLIEQYSCNVFGFDPTPKSIAWVKKQDEIPGFNFIPVGISDKCGELSFFLPKNSQHVSGSLVDNDITNTEDVIAVPVKDLKTIADELGHKCIDVLKMDIEGAEYDVIGDILASGIEVKQFLIEFHHRLYEGGNKKTQNAIRQLSEKGYKVYAVSDLVEEISFIKMG